MFADPLRGPDPLFDGLLVAVPLAPRRNVGGLVAEGGTTYQQRQPGLLALSNELDLDRFLRQQLQLDFTCDQLPVLTAGETDVARALNKAALPCRRDLQVRPPVKAKMQVLGIATVLLALVGADESDQLTTSDLVADLDAPISGQMHVDGADEL